MNNDDYRFAFYSTAKINDLSGAYTTIPLINLPNKYHQYALVLDENGGGQLSSNPILSSGVFITTDQLKFGPSGQKEIPPGSLTLSESGQLDFDAFFHRHRPLDFQIAAARKKLKTGFTSKEREKREEEI